MAMNDKKKKWLPVKEILFYYLAASKVLYWVEIAASLELNVFNVVLNRLLNRDIVLISSIVWVYVLEKLLDKINTKDSKVANPLKHVVLYVFGYIGLIALYYIYVLALSLFLEINFMPLATFASEVLSGYILIVVALSLKDYFKNKEKKSYSNRLAALKTFCDDGILTQEEYERIEKDCIIKYRE